MPTLGVTTAIIQCGKVLLTLREDIASVREKTMPPAEFFTFLLIARK